MGMKFMKYGFVFLFIVWFVGLTQGQWEPQCPTGQTYNNDIGACALPEVVITPDEEPNTQNSNMWIDCSQEQLLNGQCKFNIYDTLGIRQNSSQNEPAVFVQDAIFAATTFIGTVITIALIFSGLLFIRAGLSANEWLQDRAKKWLINSVIGLLLVISSYMIIRLVQFIIRWW